MHNHSPDGCVTGRAALFDLLHAKLYGVLRQLKIACLFRDQEVNAPRRSLRQLDVPIMRSVVVGCDIQILHQCPEQIGRNGKSLIPVHAAEYEVARSATLSQEIIPLSMVSVPIVWAALSRVSF